MAQRSTQQSVFGILSELNRMVGEERVAGALGSLFDGVAGAKARVDANIETMLALANVPSSKELARLTRKVEALQRSVINLTRKVDELVATNGAGGTPAESGSPAAHHAAPKRRAPQSAAAKPATAKSATAKGATKARAAKSGDAKAASSKARTKAAPSVSAKTRRA